MFMNYNKVRGVSYGKYIKQIIKEVFNNNKIKEVKRRDKGGE